MAFFPSHTIVDLSRWQFAFTAIFHFIFVPLTLGLTWMLVVMETRYLMTGKAIYKTMTQFWGKILGINFAMGVVTGMTMEFEFGQNWSYFSRFIGGSFGPILAIEGITAFMLEATMFGLFFFGWSKLSKRTHWCVTLLMAIGASLSIVNILSANSWMRHAVATTFDPNTMTLNLHSLAGLYLSNLAQISIGHVAFGAFLLSSIFVIGVSAFYLLKHKYTDFAKRSIAIAAGFGLASALAVGFFGDQNGLAVQKYEPEKMAALEAQWQTQKAPAAWYAIAWPNQQQEKNDFVLKIPYALSLITSHNLKGTVEGLKPIMAGYKPRIRIGHTVFEDLMKIREKDATPQEVAYYNANRQDLGLGFLYQYVNGNQPVSATTVEKTARAAIPDVAMAFWTFRIMVGLWALMTLSLLLLVAVLFFRRRLRRFHLYLLLLSIPLPWLAIESGWVLCENGRQPWAVHLIIPTGLASSIHDVWTMITSLSCFVGIYLILFAVELFLMFKYARMGPVHYLPENQTEGA